MNKKILSLFAAFFVIAQFVLGQNECNDTIPGWGENLGEITFKTNRTWIVGNQEWSDVVMATACKKETYFSGLWIVDERGIITGDLKAHAADCRKNKTDDGDLFSWCAVVRFQDELCPAPWRVPDSSDFRTLHLALGGRNVRTSEGYSSILVNNFIQEKYINVWGGSYGSFCDKYGVMCDESRWEWYCLSGRYWSKSEYLGHGIGLYFYYSINSSGMIYPQSLDYKGRGYMLRCVRDK